MNKSLLLTLPLLILLNACATLSEKECRTADWRQLGVADGQKGYPDNRLESHREACKDFGILPDTKLYLDGRNAGLATYCQPDNAFRLGMNGESYKGVCPPEVDMAFRRNNEAALAVHRSKKQLENINSQLSDKERALKKNGLADANKTRLHNDIKELEKQRERARQDLRDQQRELDLLMNVNLLQSTGELIRQIIKGAEPRK